MFMDSLTVDRPICCRLQSGPGGIIKQRPYCLAAAGGCRQAAYVTRSSLKLEFGLIDVRDRPGFYQATALKRLVMGPSCVHLGEEGHYRRRSAVHCQTDDSELGWKASLITAEDQEQLNKLVIIGLPQECAVLVPSLMNLVLPPLVRVRRSSAGLVP